MLRGLALGMISGFTTHKVYCAPHTTAAAGNDDEDDGVIIRMPGGKNKPETAESNAQAVDVAEEDTIPVDPVKAVVVGGGFAGGKLSQLFDSIFDVTLVDSKNFLEFAPDLVPILCSEWTQTSEEALKKSLTLHRFYLKRANVVTGKGTSIVDDGKALLLEDGRRVPFDLVVLTTGAQRAFPYATERRTLRQRAEEIKFMNQFIAKDCERIAIVGAGPMGASTASFLAQTYPNKQIDLFTSGPTVLPSLPRQAREKGADIMSYHKNLNIHLNATVTEVERVAGEEGLIAKPSLMDRILGRQKRRFVGLKDTFDLRVEKRAGGSIVVNSVLKQWWFGLPPSSKVVGAHVASTETFSGYDYVFNCGGVTPNNDTFSSDPTLGPHLRADGKFRVSTLQQLLGHVNIFAVGNANALPFQKSYSNVNVEARSLFRNFYGVVSSTDPENVKTMEGNGLTPSRMQLPRILLALGPDDAVGSTAWGGSVVGYQAQSELIQERVHLINGFVQPIFYKPHDPIKVRSVFDKWREKEVTDVADFVN